MWIFIFDGGPDRLHSADIQVVILKLAYHDPFLITSQGDNPLPEHMVLVSLAYCHLCGCCGH